MTATELDPRFARQLDVPELGPDALARLQRARVHVVGAGAMAGPALLALAQAGVGTLLLDDAGDVGPSDAAAWLYDPAGAGLQRPLAALAPLRAASASLQVRLWSSQACPNAALVCVEEAYTARDASDRARRAGLPHVVALAGMGRGHVATFPHGAPCLRCALPPDAYAPPSPADAAAAGLLAAVELVLLLARPGRARGRRIDLEGGWPTPRETVRREGCDCDSVY